MTRSLERNHRDKVSWPPPKRVHHNIVGTGGSKVKRSGRPLLHSLRLCSLAKRVSGISCRRCSASDGQRSTSSSAMRTIALVNGASSILDIDDRIGQSDYGNYPTLTDLHHRSLLKDRSPPGLHYGVHYARRQLPSKHGTGDRRSTLYMSNSHSKKSLRDKKVKSIIGIEFDIYTL